MHPQKNMISIWFFIGVLLLVYGVLITGAGIYDWISPSPMPVVLSQLHASFWWGLVLLAIGSFYTYRFRPPR